MLQPAEAVFKMMNKLGDKRKPFLFAIDYEVSRGFILNPAEAATHHIYFEINGIANVSELQADKKIITFRKFPVAPETYRQAFTIVKKHLDKGNSYLTNLTFETPIETEATLSEIFTNSNAKYRLLFDGQFVVFSPEIFVHIENGTIRSFPMKGTIDAAFPDAENQILNDVKETAEHHTIVDLIRNDLGTVATKIKVERFRYIETIRTQEKTLLQVSSEISGKLNLDYHSRLGDIFRLLLPAGSISGAPKKKTLEIINEAENYNRGFYTGIVGLYDGVSLDSGVLIRFIRNEKDKLVFCSGGGITSKSDWFKEYQEMIDKVYVPVI